MSTCPKRNEDGVLCRLEEGHESKCKFGLTGIAKQLASPESDYDYTDTIGEPGEVREGITRNVRLSNMAQEIAEYFLDYPEQWAELKDMLSKAIDIDKNKD